MKKITILTLLTLALLLLIVVYAIQSRQDTDDSMVDTESDAEIIEKYATTLTFSNLVDKASQAEVRRAMEYAGISIENIDSFFEEVDTFNKTVENISLVPSGFTTIEKLEPGYDLGAMIDMWDAKYPEFIGYNCRITTFALMRDLVSIETIDTTGANWLVFDEYAIANNPKQIFNQTERKKFQTLFSSVPAEDTTDITVHLKNVQEHWQKNGVKFIESDKSSIISVFFHDFEDYIFIGHMGVLLSTEDDGLIFIEKLVFQAPYQAIKFANRTELNDYLMNKYDVSWNQPTAKPFIMENDQLMAGYRANPNNVDSDVNVS